MAKKQPETKLPRPEMATCKVQKDLLHKMHYAAGDRGLTLEQYVDLKLRVAVEKDFRESADRNSA